MPGKTPQRNNAGAGKAKKPTKDADEEMTVVVPPSKKQPASSADADVDMGDADADEAGVDPAVQATAGTSAEEGRGVKRATHGKEASMEREVE